MDSTLLPCKKLDNLVLEFLKLNGCPIERFNEWGENKKSVLRKILSGDAVTRESVINMDQPRVIVQEISFDDEFKKFCEKCPKWNTKDAVLFWKNYTHLNTLKVLRRQLTGLCFMHAPVVLHHYMNTIQNGDNNYKMIDVAKYIHDNWPYQRIIDYIENDRGGDSISFLESIIGNIEKVDFLIPKLDSDLFEKTCNKIRKLLKKQPALVSGFEVDMNFHQDGVSFSGKRQQKYGNHAMLLIGIHRKKNLFKRNEYTFILQNWWKHRFFIEVSAEYFNSCNAKITFIFNKIDTTEGIKYIYSPYAETIVDFSEKLHEI